MSLRFRKMRKRSRPQIVDFKSGKYRMELHTTKRTLTAGRSAPELTASMTRVACKMTKFVEK